MAAKALRDCCRLRHQRSTPTTRVNRGLDVIESFENAIRMADLAVTMTPWRAERMRKARHVLANRLFALKLSAELDTKENTHARND